MTSPDIRVLVAEDDEDLRTFLHDSLEAEGMAVETASDGAGALLAVGSEPPDIVLLDLDLPDVDGLDVLSALRRRGNLPVIVLTGRRLEEDRIVGLELGADDYMLKPFSTRELVARIRTVLRRSEPTSTDNSVLEFDGLVVDRTARTVTVNDRSVELTKREFDLLAFLAANPHEVFSRQDLLAKVWGSSEYWQVPATVTEHVRRIRLKVEPDPSTPRWLHNVRGVGYRFGS